MRGSRRRTVRQRGTGRGGYGLEIAARTGARLEWRQPGNCYLDSAAHDEVAAILRPVTGRGTSRAHGQDPVRIQITIRASGLPGLDCGPGENFPGYRNIHVAIHGRRRDDLLGLRPGSAATAVWTLEATTVPGQAGTDIKGPFIQGRPGARFICLSWGTVDDTGGFTMFPAGKADARRHRPGHPRFRPAIRIPHRAPDLHRYQRASLCAAVRPPLIEWPASTTG